MRRPLCTICLAVIVLVAVYTGLHPPKTVSYEAVSGSMVQVTGQVYAKKHQQGKDAPILVLFLEPQKLICHQQKIPFQNNFICYISQSEGESIQGSFCSSGKEPASNSPVSTEEPAMGSIVCIRGILTEFEPASNPGQFDEKAYYATLGISGRLYNCRVLEESEDHDPVKESLWKVRNRASKLLYDIFPPKDASILSAMLLGDKSGLLTETRDLYKDAGILHILAISGLHISFLGMGLFNLLRKIRIPVCLACILSGLVMIAYGIMVGMPVSAIRAIGMFLIRLLAVSLKRTYDMITALFLCAALTVIREPLLLYHTGFQLSYLAELAILVMKPIIMPPLEINMHDARGVGPVLLRYTDGFFTTLSITFFLLPVQLSAFYEVSFYSPILNLLILPLVGFVMAVGLLCVLLQLTVPFLEKIGVLAVHIVLNTFSSGAKFLNGLPGAMWIFGKPSIEQIIIFYGIILGVIRLKELPYKYKIGLLIGAILILSVRVQSGFQVTFLDIGQGDCAVVELPNGGVWLVDGGSSSVSDVGTYRVEPFLKSKGIHKLDAVFLSHGDSDHINGVENILLNGDIQIKMLVLPVTERAMSGDQERREEQESFQAITSISGFDIILQQAESQNIPILWMDADMKWNSGQVSVECLHPGREFISADSNVSSQVLYMRYGNFSVLFTGDVEGKGELQLLEALTQRGLKDITILKVAHHGSQNSTSREFLDVVNPQYAVISCGENNRYRHPHLETLERLWTADTRVLRTDESGAITVLVKDGKVHMKEYRK